MSGTPKFKKSLRKSEMDNKEFEREDRYAVIKYKKLTNHQWTLVPELLEKFDKARVDCVVVEKDWPEYHLVWAMLEHRMSGKPVPDFNLWRKADELQQRLTAAEQRNAALIDLIQKAHTWVDRNNCGGWDAYELRDQLAAALKPTESGASE